MHDNVPHASTPTLSSVKNATADGASKTKPTLPYTTSNVDDFLQKSSRERKVSSSSDDNPDYEPYSRRDFRMDLKPSDKVMSSTNDTPTSGYFTSSPNDMKEANIFSPESSDYERFDHQSQIIKKREEYSSSPVDSQRSTSSLCRKSVSFDLDIEEYTPPYKPNDDDDNDEKSHENDDNVLYYEKSRSPHQNELQPKRIKGILRASSPNVYYHQSATALQNRTTTAVAKEFIENENDNNQKIEKENPFRKEYLSQEVLDTYDKIQIKAPSVIKTLVSDVSDQQQQQHGSLENLNKNQPSKIPIKKSIFKASGNLIDDDKQKVTVVPTTRPMLPPPPPRPLKPQVKVAEMVKNEGLEKMSQQMDEEDFMEFVHDVKTNTIQEVKSHSRESFNPESAPLPPIPKTSPPTLHFRRTNSKERPKDSPPPPPIPIAKTPTSEIIEILPVKFESFPRKQTPNFINENSPTNILVTEDEHRDILLKENELRNAILTEYDEKLSNNSEILIQNFSSTNPFLDDDAASFSFSYGSSPNLLSPVSTLDKSSSSTLSQYTPVYRDASPVNILPPQPQVLPVHYSQLPKPQQPIGLTQHQSMYYNPAQTGIISTSSSHPHQFAQQYYAQPPPMEATSSEHYYNRAAQSYLVSGDGQNNIYVTHTVNNTSPPNNQNHTHQTLLMQSAYAGPVTIAQQQNQHHHASMHQIPPNQPQFIYEQYSSMDNTNSMRNLQYVQQTSMELSPIRVNQMSQNNFMFTSGTENKLKKPSMSSFGKHTEV